MNWNAIATVFALLATVANSYFTYNSYTLSQEIQKSALFSQFQQQYDSISARFPNNLLEKDYQPKRGSNEYKRLQDYWIFCYAEWFATNKSGNSGYRNLWTDYYVGLIQNALEIPSLRYVLQDMMQSYGTDKLKMQAFYNEIRRLAQQEGIALTRH